MKRALGLVFLLVFAMALTVSAATKKTYQVTGPVLEVRSDAIVVQKGNEKWEVERDAATKITGDVKVGETVTIEYRMMATSVTVKPPKAAPKKK